MRWFFVIWVATSGWGDTITIPSHSTTAEVAMPSQEVCETIQQLNRSGECIARLPKPKAQP